MARYEPGVQQTAVTSHTIKQWSERLSSAIADIRALEAEVEAHRDFLRLLQRHVDDDASSMIVRFLAQDEIDAEEAQEGRAE